ncbi:NAD(P)H-quinone oxidoreductase [Alkalispirochaeta sphaeroplastigenens]|uniref:NAD(P)H dehydrogenase (quinone) n=1 Tax=Alkalispirochaeta sphaeroplastigenens TaxID=1187066 RepID=A0A2S4JNR2_9SPIO|nr:NAD(P)H:quinone oxidoreductase [Alkalispirochaeta sphaeroplastigenens]POR01155.1 NAD(P)H-quinone oxidoreductase [Alkalispirochaeta sphaeroplastigenens]
MKILVVFYSTYGHMYAMATAAAEGAKAAGAEVQIRRVPELLGEDILGAMGALEAQKAFSHIQEVTHQDLTEADGIIFGVPTRFGNMPGQMRMFLDSTGPLWVKGSLVGKVGSVITSTGSQHGGAESTILSTHITLLHHGMVLVGLPYTFQEQMKIDTMNGGSPYGASTITGADGSRMPSEVELAGARFQGDHVARIAGKLA